MSCLRARYFERRNAHGKDFVLDVRRALILINATGETLFVTNEKIVLTIMLLFYEEKEWWTPKEIIEKAKEAGVGDRVLKLSSIEETLNNKKRKAKEHELFTKDNENDCYCLNVNGMCRDLKQRIPAARLTILLMCGKRTLPAACRQLF